MVLGGALSVERSRSLRASPLFGSALAFVAHIAISPTRVDGRHDQHPHKESLVGQRPPAPRARRRITRARGHPLPSHHTADRIDHLPQLPERKRPLINGQNREPLIRFVATWAANPQGQPISDQERRLPNSREPRTASEQPEVLARPTAGLAFNPRVFEGVGSCIGSGEDRVVRSRREPCPPGRFARADTRHRDWLNSATQQQNTATD